MLRCPIIHSIHSYATERAGKKFSRLRIGVVDMLNYGQKEYIKYRSADAAKALQNFSLNMH
jgi:hypothetical protein